MAETLTGFRDPTPVTITVELTRGELAALIDDPVTLRGVDPRNYYVTAKQRAIGVLREARERQAVRDA